MNSDCFCYFTHDPKYVPSGKHLFVSTVGGFDQKVNSDLQRVLQEPTIPELIFFLGDMSATKTLANLENIFNDIYQAMEKLLSKNRHPSDMEIKMFPIRDDFLLINACRKLHDALKEIDPTYSRTSYVSFAWYVWVSENFNKFIDNLSPCAQEVIQKEQTRNAEDYIHLMTQFAEKGSRVIIVEGDKDINPPLKFNFKDHIALASERIQYVHQPKVIETDDYVFVVWPYDSQPSEIPYLSNPYHKTVVVISHSHFISEAVEGNDPNNKKLTNYMTKDDERIDGYMMDVVQQLGAKYGVHGHLHRPTDRSQYDAYRISYFMKDQGPRDFYAYFIEGIKAVDF